ncbi:unnamed protein product [Clavelina lepadiformis]|uniref:RING-type domain-containing protein n=1 Tax=Clavelina lepadiformis TaxID=159417 RepID=A0ABP0GIJ4_CLALP
MDSTERDISCAICPDTLKPPIRILPCLHSVCESCVKELLQSNTNDPKCQKCDGNITLEVEEIENLPLNRLLQIYIEMKLCSDTSEEYRPYCIRCEREFLKKWKNRKGLPKRLKSLKMKSKHR